MSDKNEVNIRVYRLIDRIAEMIFLASACEKLSKSATWWKQPYWWVQTRRAQRILEVSTEMLMEIIRSPGSDTRKDSAILLSAGETLLEAGYFKHATECFTHVLNFNNTDYSDNLRMLALMGILESEVAIRFVDVLINGAPDQDGYMRMKYRYITISSELYTAKSEVQTLIRARLARIDTKLGIIRLGIEVNLARPIYAT